MGQGDWAAFRADQSNQGNVIKSASEPSSHVATSQVAKSQAHQNTSTGLVALNPSPFRKRTLLQEQDDSEEANEKINL